MKTIDQIREWAFECHKNVNHKYDIHEYSEHLERVANAAKMFSHLIPDADFEDILGGCYCHDVIEDTRKTYNDVLEATNFRIAEISYALTNEKGKNRRQRANSKYYKGIRANEYARFVKICDRIANMTYSKETGSKMYKVYKRELPGFKKKLNITWTTDKYQEMFDYLENL